MPRKAAVEEPQFVEIDLELAEVEPDYQQYKPVKPKYHVTGVMVRVKIPATEVISNTKGRIVVTPEGAALITSQLIEAQIAVGNQPRRIPARRS